MILNPEPGSDLKSSPETRPGLGKLINTETGKNGPLPSPALDRYGPAFAYTFISQEIDRAVRPNSIKKTFDSG